VKHGIHRAATVNEVGRRVVAHGVQPAPVELQAIMSDPASPEDSSLQGRVVRALAASLSSDDRPVRVLETHISFVLLTGAYAYKIKKAVKLPFLDFGTLALRKQFCDEELRLNRRLAPDLYLDVVPITGPAREPAIAGDGPVLEYAVRMREFAQEGLLSNVLERNELLPEHVDRLAAEVADFHVRAAQAPAATRYGAPRQIVALALANFTEIAPFPAEAAERQALRDLRRWTRDEYRNIRDALERRRRNGAIRECHGDLHLGNIALIDDDVTIFDCIEFNPSMRWIDTMSEVAFTVMDLEHRKRADLAYRYLSAYCERSGDYDGIQVLRFYLVYRAMVRAKIACVRASQLAPCAGRDVFHDDFEAHLRLATSYANDRRPGVVVMHGLSGSGKTTLSQRLLERAKAVRIRTDVERKRLAGLAAGARSGSDIAGGLYASDATHDTYEHVLGCAHGVIRGRFTAIVDGAFLKRWQRDRFRSLAAESRVPFVIVDCVADEATLEARLVARGRAGNDASEADTAVLQHQLRTSDALSSDELRFTLACDAAVALTPCAWDIVVDRIRAGGQPPDSAMGTATIDGDLSRKVALLSRPSSYVEKTAIVEAVETHRSWVFLTEDHAYKLKKPVRDTYVHLRRLEARRRNCDEELRVNRRFAEDVYLGVVPLVDQSGFLRLDGRGKVVDWLLRMRRLPHARMLDRIIASGRFGPATLVPVVDLLCAVYRSARVELTAAEYQRRLSSIIDDNERVLCGDRIELPVDEVVEICARQRRFLSRPQSLTDRVPRIVEGHGDLRPEHICLEGGARIIDSLEFSLELRTLDPADELGFLALECERLGAPHARRFIFNAYRRSSGDSPSPALIHFYQSLRACVRAALAMRHILDPDARDPERWPIVGRRYLDLARIHIGTCEPDIAFHPLRPTPRGETAAAHWAPGTSIRRNA